MFGVTLCYSPQELSANRSYFHANPRHTSLHTSPTEPQQLRLFCNIFCVLSEYTFILSLIYNSLTGFVSLYFILKIYFCQMDFKILSCSIIYWFYFHFLREYFLPSWYHHFHSFAYFIHIKCYKCGSELDICISLAKWEISLALMEISHWNGPT